MHGFRHDRSITETSAYAGVQSAIKIAAVSGNIRRTKTNRIHNAYGAPLQSDYVA